MLQHFFFSFRLCSSFRDRISPLCGRRPPFPGLALPKTVIPQNLWGIFNPTIPFFTGEPAPYLIIIVRYMA